MTGNRWFVPIPFTHNYGAVRRLAREQDGRRRYRIVAHRDELGPAVLVSRGWSGEPPGGWLPQDDLVILLDPALGREIAGRWVNMLRDAGHEVEIVWPRKELHAVDPDAPAGQE